VSFTATKTFQHSNVEDPIEISQS